MAGLVLFDTNILIDWSKGYKEALNELAHWDNPAISAITWMELYGGADVMDVPRFDEFMADFGFEIIEIDAEIMRKAASIVSERRRHGPRIALPDAIIQATADVKNLTIITRNTKDFRGRNVRVPYELETISTTMVVNVDPPGDTPVKPRTGSKFKRLK
ncbi:PIN domain-containing protein [Duganella sp. FT80W]|uniref:Ribonuclease VapC n=1 Tax=Duganella guangzhouensis TaxID=2666084 RepID=A0A6I2L144_9BURK|nr:PIN domain-containing protein [Duganella guangzhouensis]MRW91891.1 PIN domain-containing protein [Duganella guangzhouensis]